MKIYNTNVTVQNLGSNLLVILRGKHNDIEQTFNSFYNHGATGGSLTYPTDGVGVFWSTKESLIKYWTSIFAHRHWGKFHHKLYDKYIKGQSKEVVDFFTTQMAAMLKDSEIFIDFSNKNNNFDEFSNGTVVSERPDDSFKDMATINGFQNKTIE